MVTLDKAMAREFSAAKLCWMFAPLAQLAGLSVAVATFFGAIGLVVAASAGVAVPMVSALARAFAIKRYSRGEELRRALIRSDGWGKKVASHELLLSLADGSRAPSWDPPPIGTYFSSPHSPGARRVAHIVQQSAFFTVRHTATMVAICATIVASSFTVGVALLWLLAQGLFAAAVVPAITHAAGALLAFSTTSEFLSFALSYGRLHKTARRTVEQCGALAHQPAPADEHVGFVVGSYDVGLAQSPPIPGIIYRIERARLERAWQVHEAKPTPAPTTG